VKLNEKILVFIAYLLISHIGFGQTDFPTKFSVFCQARDTLAERQLLEKWQHEKPNDPELYTSYFNYYFSKSKNEVVTLTTEEPEGKKLVIKDSLNQIAGFLGAKTSYNEFYFTRGIHYINEGIRKFPNRLDMYFGKIYAYGQHKKWDVFTKEIITVITYSAKNKNQWVWTNNEPVENSEDFFLSSIQSYINQLYRTGDDRLLNNMKQISETVLKYYPNNVESLSNISVVYLLNGEYDKGLAPLLKAEKINPKDYIVLGNIAQTYKLKGNKEMSIKYYEKMLKYGDGQTKEFAKEQIANLKK
jgi:tetratricopeptide (TPR) repeat protein